MEGTQLHCTLELSFCNSSSWGRVSRNLNFSDFCFDLCDGHDSRYIVREHELWGFDRLMNFIASDESGRSVQDEILQALQRAKIHAIHEKQVWFHVCVASCLRFQFSLAFAKHCVVGFTVATNCQIRNYECVSHFGFTHLLEVGRW